MARINLLGSEIFNRIAAGEVVENPKAVVKELFENCIDAGATMVIIEIQGGGIDSIKITDNGCGMSSVDLEKSVLPHATSKISSLDDLNQISTLGFRGEALPSIASVSNLKIVSREKGSQLGNFIEYDFGTCADMGECGAAEGTCITVENLFNKVPARKKFLKKSSAEAAEISALVVRLIISNYNVSIKYISDGKTVYHSDGGGIQSAIYAVYGKEFTENMVFLENTMPDIAVHGFIGKPGFSKHNRTFQTLVVNGRYVVNSDITYLIQNCYRDYLLSREFPVWILFIDIPKDMVDVNVHPSKMDVKFADFSMIKKVLYSTVLDVVKSLSSVPNAIFGKSSVQSGDQENIVVGHNPLNDIDRLNSFGYNQDENRPSNSDFSLNPKYYSAQTDNNSLRGDNSLRPTSNFLFGGDINSAKPTSDFLFGGDTSSSRFTSDYLFGGDTNSSYDCTENKDVQRLRIAAENLSGAAIRENSFFTSNLERKGYADSESAATTYDNSFASSSLFPRQEAEQVDGFGDFSKHQQELSIDDSYKIKLLCKLFNTYILFEYKGDIYVIDQHAAHERIIYDEIMSKYSEGQGITQPLLLPYVFDLSYDEGQIIDENLETLQDMGFSLSKLSGKSYCIDSVPYACSGMNCAEFIRFFFDNLGKNSLKHSDLIKEKAARAACKAAVKGRDDLSTHEMNTLLNMLKEVEQLFCPHGRPVMVKLTKNEIEKWFKRI